MKNQVLNFILIGLVSNLFFAESTLAQISRKGTPPSEVYSNLENINNLPIIIMEKFDIDKLIEEDKLPENRNNKPLRFAKAFDVNINVKEEGLLEILPNNDKLWRLRIKSPGAYSLNLTFGEYVLPVGAKIFISNKSKTHTVGAFTEENNKPSKILAIQPVEGDEIIIEYSEPSEITNPGKLIISRVGHDYTGIFKRLNTYDGRYGQSAWCNVDINCTAGDDWQTEKWSVCRILINNTSYCSGSLINNTSNDYKTLFLTANHCISTTAEANNTVFVFNYESPSCNGPDGSVSQSISGSTLRAHWSTSDFSLVELSSMPPISYYPVWNGWDRRTITPSGPVTCIHHPAGDVRKISIDSDPVYIEGNFWCVDNWDTGTTQGGSSGSPLYNSDKRVVGQDSYSDCSGCDPCDSDKGSCYGKISSSWNGGGTSASRLRNWLDPNNTGVDVLSKIRTQYISGPSIVCTSNTTFTLHNRPSGTTVNWTKSTNLRYEGGQGTDNYTVKAYWYSAGPGWVDATITGDCGDVTIRKYIPWVGTPDPDDLDILNPDNVPDNTLCEGEENQLIAGYSGSQTILDYDWDYPGWSHYEVGAKDFISFVTVPYSFSYADIKLRAENECGESEWRTERFYPNQNCGYFFSFSPNPADDYVEIIINESKLAENEIDYYEVRIYNSLKIAVFETGKTKEPLLRINTKQFQNGIYFIYFIAGGKTDVKQLVVNH